MTLIESPLDLEPPISRIGTDLAARMPKPRAVSTARVERRMTEMLVRDPALRAALFRFVDVRPACATPWDVTRHLHELLEDAHDSGHARRASCDHGPQARHPARGRDGRRRRQADGAALHRRRGRRRTRSRRSRSCGATASRRPSTCSARPRSPRPRPTATPSAARTRCGRSRRPRPEPRPGQPERQGLRAHAAAARPGARARDRGRPAAAAPPAARRPRREGAPARRHGVLRHPRGDHRPDARPAQSEPEFAARPERRDRPAGLPDRVAGAPRAAARLGARAPARAPAHDPAGQGRLLGPRGRPGRPARLGAAGVHRPPRVRPQLRAAHPAPDRRDADRPGRDRQPQPALDLPRRRLRRARGLGDDAIEFQILRGLGDDTQAALAATGRRVRAYCPVGDLVAGMAYLVRRLLENTANDSFLAAHASGTDTAELLEAP